MVRLLYEPQFLHTLCGITSSPHVEHTARFGTDIFQLALRLSRLAFEILFLGHIDIAYTSLTLNLSTALSEPYPNILLACQMFVKLFYREFYTFTQNFKSILQVPAFPLRSSAPRLLQQQEPLPLSRVLR